MASLIGRWWSLYAFTQSSFHNVALVFVYAGILWQFYRWFQEIKASRRHGARLAQLVPSFFGWLLLCLLLSSLLLYLLQPEFLSNWRFTGWLYTDLVLCVVCVVFLLSVVLFLIRTRKKSQSLRQSFFNLGVLLIVDFLVGNFVLLVFCGGFFEVIYSSDEIPVLISSEKQSLLVNKERKRIPNGTSNGLSTSITDFMLSGIDLESGKEIWHRHSSWQEYVIGDTPNGLFVVNSKKEAVYFLDRKTGKQILSEAEWIREMPELDGKLSYAYTDYCIVGEALYFYGLDGKYYQVDFKAKQVNANNDYQELIFTHNLFTAGHKSMENFERRQHLAALYPDFLEVTLNTQLDDQRALVVYKAKRNAKDVELALVSLEQSKVFWQVTLELSEDTDNEELQVFAEKGNIYALPGKYLYKLDEKTGQLLYKYSYQTNHLE